jgi:hypothetical protein
MVGSGVVSDDRKSAAPAALVEDGVRHGGRLPARPVRVNPLDEFGGTSRLLRRLRLKEWAGLHAFPPGRLVLGDRPGRPVPGQL